jgi:hypothetical protein
LKRNVFDGVILKDKHHAHNLKTDATFPIKRRSWEYADAKTHAFIIIVEKSRNNRERR